MEPRYIKLFSGRVGTYTEGTLSTNTEDTLHIEHANVMSVGQFNIGERS